MKKYLDWIALAVIAILMTILFLLPGCAEPPPESAQRNQDSSEAREFFGRFSADTATVHEFKLTDGTPCVIVVGSGTSIAPAISCGWATK